jgi:hypothetical protein
MRVIDVFLKVAVPKSLTVDLTTFWRTKLLTLKNFNCNFTHFTTYTQTPGASFNKNYIHYKFCEVVVKVSLTVSHFKPSLKLLVGLSCIKRGLNA